MGFEPMIGLEQKTILTNILDLNPSDYFGEAFPSASLSPIFSIPKAFNFNFGSFDQIQ